MDEEEKQNLFETFKAVIESAVEEKKGIEKWAKKIEKTQVKVNIGLQISESDYFYINFKLNKGNLEINKGRLEDFDLEILATSTDLMFMSNGTYGTLHLLTKKNEFGKTKLRVKKGGRNIGKLLFVQGLLTFA